MNTKMASQAVLHSPLMNPTMVSQAITHPIRMNSKELPRNPISARGNSGGLKKSEKVVDFGQWAGVLSPSAMDL